MIIFESRSRALLLALQNRGTQYFREKGFPFLFGAFWQALYILNRVVVADVVHVVRVGRAQHRDDPLYLIQIIFAGKEWSAPQ